MKTTRFTSVLYLLALTCFLTVANNTANAQNTTFTGSTAIDDFNAATLDVGTRVDDDFASLRDVNGDEIDLDEFTPLLNPQDLAFGQISGPVVEGASGQASFSAIPLNDGVVGVVTALAEADTEEEPIVFTFNNPELGPLNGFLFSFTRPLTNITSGDVVVSTFNGDTPLESFVVSSDELSSDANGVDSFSFGLINDDASQNITSVEVMAADGSETDGALNGLIVTDARFVFSDVEPPVETCFAQLTDVGLEVSALLANSEGRDAAYLRGALSCIQWSQSDFFWEQPSGDRLSIYGSSVFIGAAYTVSYLQRVDDPQADVIVDQLLDVLECIVDNEIEYAIANGGRESFIERAVDFAELGEIIDGDFDNQVVATLAYKLAWVHAYYSTY